MTTTLYCTVADVSDFLSIEISATSKPNRDQVTKLISEKTDWFDSKTGHAFRTKTVTNEMHHVPETYSIDRGCFINLRHRDNVVITKIERWDGSSYTDVTTSVTWSIIPETGQLFMQGFVFTLERMYRIRVSYTYGTTTIPNDVVECIKKAVAIDILDSNFLLDKLPVGADNESMSERVGRWRERVDEIIQQYTEWMVID